MSSFNNNGYLLISIIYTNQHSAHKYLTLQYHVRLSSLTLAIFTDWWKNQISQSVYISEVLIKITWSNFDLFDCDMK